MITFNDDNSYTITAKGDYSQHLMTMKSIIRAVACQRDDVSLNNEECYFLMELLEDMLPTEDQMAIIAKYSEK